jgi:hypothetical protein
MECQTWLQNLQVILVGSMMMIDVATVLRIVAGLEVMIAEHVMMVEGVEHVVECVMTMEHVMMVEYVMTMEHVMMVEYVMTMEYVMMTEHVMMVVELEHEHVMMAE